VSNPIELDSGQGAWRPRPSPRAIVFTIALGLITVLCAALFPCTQTIRDTSTQGASLNHLKQIALAMDAYHEFYGHLPPPTICDKEGRPLFSWRVALLPFMEQGCKNLYQLWHLDEPWDSPHNDGLLYEMPRVYSSPWSGIDPPNTTRFQVLVGPGSAFEREGLSWNDFSDGRENTIMVVEAANPVPWSEPADLAYKPTGPMPRFKTHEMPIKYICFHVGHKPSFVAAFGDKTLRFIRADKPESSLRALITRNGGEKVDPSSLE